MRTRLPQPGQLDLFADLRQHTATAYPLDRLPAGTEGPGWWGWRCTCGADSTTRRNAWSHASLAYLMAWHHMHDTEPLAWPDHTKPDPFAPGTNHPWIDRCTLPASWTRPQGAAA